MPREIIMRNVGLGVATLPTGEKAVVFAEQDRSEIVMVPMSDENFRSLSAQWNGLVVSKQLPPAPPVAARNGGH